MELHWIVDRARSGADNMARDCALLARAETSFEGNEPAVAGRIVPPVLRVYAWDPPALSLGHHQSEDDVDLAALTARGIDLVRRPTGGAAVLHADEITWSIVAPLSECGFGRSVRAIYDSVADALVLALRSQGVAAQRAGGGDPVGFACFAAAGGHEIVVQGRKLVGTALRRGRRAFLCHGSLLTGPGHRQLVELLSREATGVAAEESASLDRQAVDLSELGVTIAPDDFATAFASTLGERLGAAPRRLGRWPVGED